MEIMKVAPNAALTAEEMMTAGLYRAAMTQICPKRSVSATTQGSIGLDWPGVKEGDIFPVASTPFLVRQKGMKTARRMSLLGNASSMASWMEKE